MATSGVDRALDELGRITLPKEIRKRLSIPSGTSLMISVEGEKIILEKFEKSCVLCGSTADVVDFKGKTICKECVEQIKSEM